MSIEKILLVKKQIEKDFSKLNARKIENFFEKFLKDKRNKDFIDYYNRTVLNEEKIDFGEFKSQWGIQGMKKTFYSFFNKNYKKLQKEIIKERDIKKFFEKYCCKERNEYTFCTKLFHTILPREFPPVDNAIRNKFGLQEEEFMESVLIIKKAYEKFIDKNPKKIEAIREVLSQSKFDYLRPERLSDIRILDMYYWFNENHKQ
ncbi:Uncharacterised protein [uncultured archaeon]|nr:Uncharacterised protein [uncultured archaeon]